MENVKTRKISSFGQKQGKNMKIGKFYQQLGRIDSYVKAMPTTRRNEKNAFQY